MLFAYIENITYLVTILGFASAGLAIAMKDMFMSMLGWCVIIYGSFRVGDRVKVFQNDTTYIGDIIDISFYALLFMKSLRLKLIIKIVVVGVLYLFLITMFLQICLLIIPIMV